VTKRIRWLVLGIALLVGVALYEWPTYERFVLPKGFDGIVIILQSDLVRPAQLRESFKFREFIVPNHGVIRVANLKRLMGGRIQSFVSLDAEGREVALPQPRMASVVSRVLPDNSVAFFMFYVVGSGRGKNVREMARMLAADALMRDRAHK